ncbi:hypothetical protein MOD24_15050 [Bacillus haynesii]|uniref:hypothetical protein n=1 Tax=Bacillus haynesii TaxID=1925021 RepID=UPI00227FF887|nr:hypothetical protein [Bacillus haynesii]MCY8577164.1 hypothetical protein [Bacillus haynesii]MEC1657137.1 hypothetical protein [Bacillus haynesii]
MKKKSVLKRKIRIKEKNTPRVKDFDPCVMHIDKNNIDESNTLSASHETIEKLMELFQSTGYPLSSDIEPYQVPIISLIKLYEQKIQEKESLVKILDQLVKDLEVHQRDLRRLEKEQQSYHSMIQTLLDNNTAQNLIKMAERKIKKEKDKSEMPTE